MTRWRDIIRVILLVVGSMLVLAGFSVTQDKGIAAMGIGLWLVLLATRQDKRE